MRREANPRAQADLDEMLRAGAEVAPRIREVRVDTRHTYLRGFTYAFGERVEICNRCGSTFEVGNHYMETGEATS